MVPLFVFINTIYSESLRLGHTTYEQLFLIVSCLKDDLRMLKRNTGKGYLKTILISFLSTIPLEIINI